MELISDFVPFFGGLCEVSLMSCAASPLQHSPLTHDCHVGTRASLSEYSVRTVALSLFGYSFAKRLHDRSWRRNLVSVFCFLLLERFAHLIFSEFVFSFFAFCFAQGLHLCKEVCRLRS